MKKAFVAAIMVSLILLPFVEMQAIEVAKANFFPDPGPDLPRIYIRSDGVVDPATAPIERTGNLYRLTDDVSLNTIEIQRNNVILDGSGHWILGNSTWVGYDAGNNGVIVANRSNVTVTNLKVAHCYSGVRVSNSSSINVVGNTFANYTTIGISVQNSSNVTIEANNFPDIYGPAINSNMSMSLIRNNNLTGGVYGIKTQGPFNVISDNRIEVLLPIIMDNANGNTIARNNMSGPASSTQLPNQNFTGNEGITLGTNCSNNVILGNNLTGFVNQAFRTVFSCSGNIFYGNYLANNGFAVVLQDGAVGSLFYGNTFAVNSCKIQIDDGVVGTRWDNGTIGNFWGDYSGTDANNDGIGDVPYTVVGFKWDQKVNGFVNFSSGQDNYPLMEPYNVEHDSIQSSLPASSPTLNSSLVYIGLSESASALNYGEMVSFTASPPEGGTPPFTFTWYVDNQQLQVVQSNDSHYFSTDTLPVGSHHVYVEIKDANGNLTTTNTVEFNVLPVSGSSSSPTPKPTSSPSITGTQPIIGPPAITTVAIGIAFAFALATIAVSLAILLKKRRSKQ